MNYLCIIYEFLCIVNKKKQQFKTIEYEKASFIKQQSVELK
jgi:hypothetical protein